MSIERNIMAGDSSHSETMAPGGVKPILVSTDRSPNPITKDKPEGVDQPWKTPPFTKVESARFRAERKEAKRQTREYITALSGGAAAQETKGLFSGHKAFDVRLREGVSLNGREVSPPAQPAEAVVAEKQDGQNGGTEPEAAQELAGVAAAASGSVTRGKIEQGPHGGEANGGESARANLGGPNGDERPGGFVKIKRLGGTPEDGSTAEPGGDVDKLAETYTDRVQRVVTPRSEITAPEGEDGGEPGGPDLFGDLLRDIRTTGGPAVTPPPTEAAGEQALNLDRGSQTAEELRRRINDARGSKDQKTTTGLPRRNRITANPAVRTREQVYAEEPPSALVGHGATPGEPVEGGAPAIEFAEALSKLRDEYTDLTQRVNNASDPDEKDILHAERDIVKNRISGLFARKAADETNAQIDRADPHDPATLQARNKIFLQKDELLKGQIGTETDRSFQRLLTELREDTRQSIGANKAEIMLIDEIKDISAEDWEKLRRFQRERYESYQTETDEDKKLELARQTMTLESLFKYIREGTVFPVGQSTHFVTESDMRRVLDRLHNDLQHVRGTTQTGLSTPIEVEDVRAPDVTAPVGRLGSMPARAQSPTVGQNLTVPFDAIHGPPIPLLRKEKRGPIRRFLSFITGGNHKRDAVIAAAISLPLALGHPRHAGDIRPTDTSHREPGWTPTGIVSMPPHAEVTFRETPTGSAIVRPPAGAPVVMPPMKGVPTEIPSPDTIVNQGLGILHGTPQEELPSPDNIMNQGIGIATRTGEPQTTLPSPENIVNQGRGTLIGEVQAELPSPENILNQGIGVSTVEGEPQAGLPSPDNIVNQGVGVLHGTPTSIPSPDNIGTARGILIGRPQEELPSPDNIMNQGIGIATRTGEPQTTLPSPENIVNQGVGTATIAEPTEELPATAEVAEPSLTELIETRTIELIIKPGSSISGEMRDAEMMGAEEFNAYIYTDLDAAFAMVVLNYEDLVALNPAMPPLEDLALEYNNLSTDAEKQAFLKKLANVTEGEQRGYLDNVPPGVSITVPEDAEILHEISRQVKEVMVNAKTEEAKKAVFQTMREEIRMAILNREERRLSQIANNAINKARDDGVIS